MKRLVIESWLFLLFVEAVMYFRDFQTLHRVVQHCSVRSCTHPVPHVSICRAMDIACVFYTKQVLCLQRSAATVLLLRRCGWDAQMVIGAQLMPFRSHAWVEVEAEVVNDKPYIQQIYQVLERC